MRYRYQEKELSCP